MAILVSRLHSSFVVECTLAYHVCEPQRKMNLPLYTFMLLPFSHSGNRRPVFYYGQHKGDPEKKNINSTVRQLTVSKQWNLIYWGGFYPNFVFNRLGFNKLGAENVSDGKGCWFWGLQIRPCQHLFEDATFWYWGRRQWLAERAITGK